MSNFDPPKDPSPWGAPPQSVPNPSFGSTTALPGAATPTTNGDRWALAALTVTITTLLFCVPGLSCLAPFVPVGAGIIALTQAKTAADPQRAKLYGWIATGFGALVLLAFIAFLVFYGAIIIQIINSPEFQRSL
ncbi:MAG: hypothetical protein MUD01_23685 [Chloroflexaceae bacterium]|jgi:hypothetical protein|nr:hypothetical protein [Chloroflexaceae bacterium]